ncbi:MAG: DUF4349 domain-containing protein [Treponema sp.]|jgi:hypothetical protein|nr:DUF4349 domain-containing protein [Treponema sp.]
MKRATLIAAAVLVLVTGCSKGAGNYGAAFSSRAAAEADFSYDEDAAEPPVPSPAEAAGAPASEMTRKLVKRVNLRIRVEDPAASDKTLRAVMEKYGAYSAAATILEITRNYTIRVPSAYCDALLADLEGMGKILYKSENVEDVTVRFYDLESRLETKRELLKTYRGYLARAANIDEILSVESRIADLESELDRTGRELRTLAGLVDYSTVELELAGPAALRSSPGLGERIGELFGFFGNFASTALLVVIGAVIFGIPVLLAAIFFFWLLFGRIGLVKRLWRLAMGKTVRASNDGP